MTDMKAKYLKLAREHTQRRLLDQKAPIKRNFQRTRRMA
jgi:hypothetical protein